MKSLAKSPSPADPPRVDALVIGIDAGGTSVRVVVAPWDAPAAPLAESRGAAQADGGPGALDAPLAGVPSERVIAVCAGVAGVSRAGIRAAWEADLARRFPHARIAVVPDFVIAFHGATGGVGIAVLAGTGSVAYGEDGRGGASRVGGRGWEYGDEGSGAWLTAEMLRRTLRALDGIADPTPLTDAVCAHLGTRDAGELAERARRQAGSDAGRGFLVPFAAQHARSGDAEAAGLFRDAADALALLARAAAARLDLPGEIPVATVGGLWEIGDSLREPFGQRVRELLPRARVIAPLAAPVRGAAARAAALTNNCAPPYTEAQIIAP